MGFVVGGILGDGCGVEDFMIVDDIVKELLSSG